MTDITNVIFHVEILTRPKIKIGGDYYQGIDKIIDIFKAVDLSDWNPAIHCIEIDLEKTHLDVDVSVFNGLISKYFPNVKYLSFKCNMIWNSEGEYNLNNFPPTVEYLMLKCDQTHCSLDNLSQTNVKGIVILNRTQYREEIILKEFILYDLSHLNVIGCFNKIIYDVGDDNRTEDTKKIHRCLRSAGHYYVLFNSIALNA